ncbi:VOC family protein [Pimelobacter simplex]|uniref:VOC family protein n=1 Tax=Nocardioides simplex TaxID=2045 RepID=A0A7J5E3T1_NOCSI|nr:VOC family protein [Pimelobacter simplex]KAB2812915.1 VOC family protein [Pimelobacter simplex]
MALATYKDLCLDATDAALLGKFWGAALGLEVEPLDDGDVRLTGPTPQHTVWVNTVPEPVLVKQRVHLDIRARDVEEVLALGATPVDLEAFPWKVLRDPEGGELCVFEREDAPGPGDRLLEVVVDCADPAVLAAWWAELLGGVHRDDEQGRWSWVEQVPGAPFADLVFVPVPEPKTVKNRVHLDLTAPDVDAVVRHGAQVLRARDDEIGWTVLADPAGNELCVFEDAPDAARG